MVSSKIHCAMAALLLAILLPVSHASGRYVAPAPAPVPVPPPPRTSPPSRIQPVVVVQGTIYCKSCNLSGYNRYMDATATDKNGYFLVMVYRLDVFRRSRCRVYLGSSPSPLCAAPFIPSNKWLGLTLERERVASLPKGVRGVYRPKSTLMFGPGTGGKCPAAAAADAAGVPMM
uniref:Uncharacterized protein n=1 Tax=Oryza rufipogon TaxID=4529 RepID=A0A0E0PQB3_ORYRU